MSSERSNHLVPTAIFLAALAGAPVPGVSDDAMSEANSEAGTASTAAETSSNLVHTEEVFVDGVRPAIPTSNTVAAKLPLALRETPASVGVVDRQRIEQQNARSLGDALRNVSGLNVQTGNGVFDFFVVRGLDSISSGLILSDGAPEPETAFYQLYNVERVEILKGPSAFLYGGSPLGGTANLVRRQPVNERFTRLGLSYGSYATTEATLDTNMASADGRWSFRLNSMWRESDGFRDGKPSEIFAVNPALTWRPNQHTSLNINFETLSSEHRSDAGLPLVLGTTVADAAREASFQSPFDISDQTIDRIQIDFETRLAPSSVLRNKTYYRSLDWSSKGTIFNGAFPTGFPDTTLLSRSLLLLDDRQEFVGNQLELIVRFETGAVTHNLLAGIEIAEQSDRFTFDVGFLPDLILENPVETAVEPIFIIPGQSFGADAKSTIIAPYLIDQIRLSENWQILAGLRWDSIDSADNALGSSRSDSEVSPMLGIVYTPSRALSVYANAGSAFAPPSTFVVDPDRQPETSDQLEVGVKKGFRNDTVQASLALFQIERGNIGIPDDNGVTQQTGDQRSRGVELEISAEISPRTQLFFSYAYTDAELTEFSESVFNPFTFTFITIDRSGNQAAFAPEQLANLWLTREFSPNWTASLGGRFVGEQFIAEDNVFQIDSALTVDAAIFFSPGHLELSLHLKNLTDTEYLTRGFGSTSVIPAPGFSVTTGARYTF